MGEKLVNECCVRHGRVMGSQGAHLGFGWHPATFSEDIPHCDLNNLYGF